MKHLFALCALASMILVPILATAASLDNAKFALHVQTKTLKSTEICTINDPLSRGIPCSQYTTAWPLGTSADLYLMVGQIDPAAGMVGLRCGIDYDGALGSGVDMFQWTGCSDGLEFPNGNWPDAGAGNTITWQTCQQTVVPPDDAHAVAGAFYVYAYGPDRFEITPNNNLAVPELTVIDCFNEQTFFPLDAVTGAVDFGGGAGVTPCVPPEPLVLQFDFDPGACPNSLGLGNGGFVIGALVGEAGQPAASIDPATILVEGVAPAMTMLRDVASPFAGTPCDCQAVGGDGVDDLRLRISRTELLAALGPVQVGDEVVLDVTGALLDGTPFSASDCAVITSQGGGMGPNGAGVALETREATADGKARIAYALPESGPVRLRVFDIRGRLVADLVNGTQPAGAHEVVWDARDQPRGVYFYRLNTRNEIQTRKLMLVR